MRLFQSRNKKSIFVAILIKANEDFKASSSNVSPWTFRNKNLSLRFPLWLHANVWNKCSKDNMHRTDAEPAF